MSETDSISVNQLIELVRERPVLWDRQADVYKNRKLTRRAWAEICQALIENYDELGDRGQHAVGRSMIGKWANLRDNWLRYWRRRQQLLSSGLPTSSLKKYIHHDQLLFLSKVYDPEGQQEVEEIQVDVDVDVDVISDPEMESPFYQSFKNSFQDSWSVSREDLKPEPQPDHHIYFFNSILPIVCDFDDNQTTDFQAAVLDSIKRIKDRENITENNAESNNLPTVVSNRVPAYLESKREILDSSQPPFKNSMDHSHQLTFKERKTENDGLQRKDSVLFSEATRNKTESNTDLTYASHSQIHDQLNPHDLVSLRSVVNRLEMISKRFTESRTGDEFSQFGRYIASFLRRLPVRKARLLKAKISKVIKKISMVHKHKIDSLLRQCPNEDSKLELNTFQIGSDSCQHLPCTSSQMLPENQKNQSHVAQHQTPSDFNDSHNNESASIIHEESSNSNGTPLHSHILFVKNIPASADSFCQNVVISDNNKHKRNIIDTSNVSELPVKKQMS